MKLTKVLLAASVSLGMAGAVQAESGQVQFKGTVLESACTIDNGQLDQSIDFKQIPQSRLNQGGKSDIEPLKIELQNCDNSTKNTVEVTFTGNTADFGDAFGVTGVDNIGIVIEQNGKPVVSGSPISMPLNQGSTIFNFDTYVMGDPDNTKPVSTGDFNSIANFVIKYS
ncbi:fimbrial protein [Cedecea sp.]|uniref:fimbrial protein n=1 Tax=Cedecea sp. TaxID=1970739 RepID=UPI002F3F1931